MQICFEIRKKLDDFSVDINYRFNQGTLVIHGESGAGKTTILNCITGIATPDEGRIVIGDNIVFNNIIKEDDNSTFYSKVNVPIRKRNIGYLFQDYALFPNLTVSQNIMYGIKNQSKYKDKTHREKLINYSEYIIETFGIKHLKKKYPRDISGGEKQRVALARAIVIKPDLLLLDEPFSALDVDTKKIIYKEFKFFKEKFKIPTILITHNYEESKMFGDDIIHLKNGKII
ncbi:ATP-binding cassette domain-containing protein [Sporosalibacterium faouarense]|uniref:ATP-binding cassette domain-containing protein n=1 Tax=Sporosalibacterium faouarense TaxID=516123 RepID=UPI00141D2D4A|nr:ATP-binding cassette domain-containing protein [Sporosalibacterium faouarense]MTI46591.1 ATP-binding cassette domain-containing protein [Bacillota bacterium]